MTTPRIGFCCIVLNRDGKTPTRFKYASATVAHVTKLSRREREAYLRSRVEQNCRALYETVNWLRQKPAAVRMFRITSGFFPLYTHEIATTSYSDAGWFREIENALRVVGNQAREHGVRLSLHPGQHCVLNSRNPETRRRAVAEFEYHAQVAELLGYEGAGRDDFAINVHGGLGYRSCEAGVHSWDDSWKRLSRRARKLITLENDEFCWNTRQIYELCDHLEVRPVLDVHHHWVESGRWPDPQGPGVAKLAAFWGDRRPKLHLSLPLPQLCEAGALDQPHGVHGKVTGLPRSDHSKTALRVHSKYIWHPRMAAYMRRWWDAGFDVQVEAKAKNRASFALYKEMRDAR